MNKPRKTEPYKIWKRGGCINLHDWEEISQWLKDGDLKIRLKFWTIQDSGDDLNKRYYKTLKVELSDYNEFQIKLFTLFMEMGEFAPKINRKENKLCIHLNVYMASLVLPKQSGFTRKFLKRWYAEKIFK